jgi:hypothetical protein
MGAAFLHYLALGPAQGRHGGEVAMAGDYPAGAGLGISGLAWQNSEAWIASRLAWPCRAGIGGVGDEAMEGQRDDGERTLGGRARRAG